MDFKTTRSCLKFKKHFVLAPSHPHFHSELSSSYIFQPKIQMGIIRHIQKYTKRSEKCLCYLKHANLSSFLPLIGISQRYIPWYPFQDCLELLLKLSSPSFRILVTFSWFLEKGLVICVLHILNYRCISYITLHIVNTQ